MKLFKRHKSLCSSSYHIDLSKLDSYGFDELLSMYEDIFKAILNKSSK